MESNNNIIQNNVAECNKCTIQVTSGSNRTQLAREMNINSKTMYKQRNERVTANNSTHSSVCELSNRLFISRTTAVTFSVSYHHHRERMHIPIPIPRPNIYQTRTKQNTEKRIENALSCIKHNVRIVCHWDEWNRHVGSLITFCS